MTHTQLNVRRPDLIMFIQPGFGFGKNVRHAVADILNKTQANEAGLAVKPPVTHKITRMLRFILRTNRLLANARKGL